MRITTALLLACLIATSGCLSAEGGDGADLSAVPHVSHARLPDPMIDFSDIIVGDHGAPQMHTIRALHGGSHLLEMVAWNDLSDKLPPGAVGTGWGAGGIWEHYACLAQFVGTGSLAIVDIDDPMDPVVVSQVGDALVNGDCQFTADGDYLFAGAYLGAVPNPAVGKDPLFPTGAPGGNGMNVWDVSDKANPVHVLFSDTGTYHTHMLHTTDDGFTYLVQAYSGSIYLFNPEGPALVEVAQITPMDHDMWVAKHPITGKTLLYSGAGSGFVIYDFDDPRAPEELAIWVPDEDRAGSAGWHRQATVDQLIDGRAIVVVAGETCGGGGTLPYAIVDVTDVTNPTTLSHWEIPGRPETTDLAHLCDMSPHEFSVFDGYVATGNYHAGVWLFDIGSAERLLEPVTLGYYIPAEEPLMQGHWQDLTWPWNPFVWGAFVDDRGYIITGDFSSGLYILKVPGVTLEA